MESRLPIWFVAFVAFDEDEIKQGRPLFARSASYVEEHQGHTDRASDAHPGELRAGRERQ